MAARTRRQPAATPRQTFQVHALFVPLVDPSGTAQQAASYVDSVAPQLWQRGVSAEVYRIRPCDLRNKRVLAALRAKGVDRLPVLFAHGRPHIGLRAIQGYYGALLAPRPPRRPARTEPSPRDSADLVAGEQDEATADTEAAEDLEEYFRQEMRVGRLGGEIELDDV